MPNEFVVKNGIIVSQGGANITGSIGVSGNIQQPQTASAQLYGVNITPTLVYTTGSQTQTALRVAPTFSGSSAFSSSQQNIIADFGATSVGTQFSVNDITSGSIYMVNDVSGLPIIEALSDWTVNMYNYPTRVFQKTGSAIIISGSLDVSGSGRIGSRLTVSRDTAVTTQVCSVITTDVANSSLVLRPSGSGAIIASIPDGTAAGGNARGTNAVDLQTARNGASQVANGNGSVLIGGEQNTASGNRSVVVGGGGSGTGNVASGPGSSVIGGATNTASGTVSFIPGGYGALAYLHGQGACASYEFASRGDSQTSDIRLKRLITGNSAAELFLDGISARAILNISSPGPTQGRLWNAKVQVSAICTAQGDGTVTVGESFIGNYAVGIKRIGSTTSLVGSVQDLHPPQADANMASSVVNIRDDNTNEALIIEYTPPSPEAGGTTTIRVVATVYLTEVGY